MFSDLDADNIERVARPKVTGSINLDKVFAGQNLDFFILFSSIACVVGNLGQSSYSAANMYARTLGIPEVSSCLTNIIDTGSKWPWQHREKTGAYELLL